MLKLKTVHTSLALEGLNLECGIAGSEGLLPSQYPYPDQIIEEEDEEEKEEDDDDDELAMEALDSFLGLLHPIHCEEEDTASGDSCEAEESQEEDADGPSEDAASSQGVIGGVRLRHPRRLSRARHRDDATRRELLQQMLATKSLLEKKQRNRRSGPGAWAVTAGEVVNEYNRAQNEAQQCALRKAVLLKQRKNSTAIKMATLERLTSSKSKKKSRAGEMAQQLEALRSRLSALDLQLRESEQDKERTLQDLEDRRNQELHLIKDLGGVDDGLGDEIGTVGSDDGGGSLKWSQSGSRMGSLSSIPSILISPSEKKTPEKIFGIKVGGREGRLKGRNPLHFLDLKLRVSRRHHKSSEQLSPQSLDHVSQDRSHCSTPANVSSDNSSDEESEHHHQKDDDHYQNHHHHKDDHHPQQSQSNASGIRTEISKEALAEIDAFKKLIDRYFATHPRHDSITTHSHEIIL